MIVSAKAPINYGDTHVGSQGHVRRQLYSTREHEGGQAGGEAAVDAVQHAHFETGNLADVSAKQHHRLRSVVLVYNLGVHRVAFLLNKII